MHISDFDYELPEDLIAQEPLPERDASRMLVLDRGRRIWHDARFTSLPEHLSPNDVLVLNDTRVFPARLKGQRVSSGGPVELLLLREVETNLWECLARPARCISTGARMVFHKAKLQAEVIESLDNGARFVKFESDDPLDQVIDKVGRTPLPPYIKRAQDSLEDRERYQTVYADKRGAIAAPTAGLHFTPTVLETIQRKGIRVARITLHVGYGTFEPIRVDEINLHRVAPEPFSISEDAARTINQAHANGGRVVAVGTTTTRALETSTKPDGKIVASSATTQLTIIPGYRFRVVDALLTNFHLPRSSLLVLVSAFADRELILEAYSHAIKERYRFYSFGDCMLIV